MDLIKKNIKKQCGQRCCVVSQIFKLYQWCSPQLQQDLWKSYHLFVSGKGTCNESKCLVTIYQNSMLEDIYLQGSLEAKKELLAFLRYVSSCDLPN